MARRLAVPNNTHIESMYQPVYLAHSPYPESEYSGDVASEPKRS
jgi:hypothetical protein